MLALLVTPTLAGEEAVRDILVFRPARQVGRALFGDVRADRDAALAWLRAHGDRHELCDPFGNRDSTAQRRFRRNGSDTDNG